MNYKVGDFYIKWPEKNFNLLNDKFMGLFETREEINGCIIECQTIYKDIENMNFSNMLQYTSSSELYETEKGKFLVYHWAMCRYAIGFYLDDLDKDSITYYFNPKMKEQIAITADWFFSVSGLHHILLKKNAPILHASYVAWDNQAILFTAPSQTGKSTQARLWEKYEGAEIINDDRVLIRKNGGKWNAYGYPSCGSSKICINKTLPLKLIVILEQGNENKIIELKECDKLRCLISGIEVYTWDVNEIDLSLSCAKEIIKDVDVIKLKCQIDKEAVSLVKQYLKGKR